MPDARKMERHQKLLAEFGEFALRSDDLDAVLTQACRLIADGLGTRHAKVLEIEEDARTLFVRAGVGWDDGIVGHLRLPMTDLSSETCSIALGAPVITNDLAVEDRYDFAAFLKDSRVRALANVPIFLPGGRPFGLLQVDAFEPRAFDDDDSQFLRTYATILGPVIDRLLKAQALAATEQRFRTIVEAARDYAILQTDVEDRITEWLPGAEAVFGWTAEEAVGQPAALLFTPEDRQSGIPMKEVEMARKQGSAPDVRWHLRKDGRRIFINGSVVPLRDPDGRLRGFQKIGQDVTERWLAENALRDSEERYRTLFEAMDEGYLLGEVFFDAANKAIDIAFLEANPAAVRLAGRNFVGQRMREIDPDYEEHWYDAYGRVALTGQSFRAQHYAERHDRWFDFQLFKVGPPESRLVASIYQDITEQKRAEAALQQSEASLKLAIEAADLGVWELDLPTDRSAMRSLRHDQMFGYPEPPAEWGQEIAERHVVPEDVPVFRAAFARALETGLLAFEVRVRWPNAEIHWISVRGRTSSDASGRPVRISGVVADVTERQRAEVALRESEERFRSIAEAIDDVFYMTDLDRDALVYLSPGYERIWGRPRSELEADLSVLLSTIHPDDRMAFSLGRSAQERRENVAIEYRIVRPDGTVRWILDRNFPVSANGGPRLLAGVASDITERREAEARVRASEERLRRFGEASTDVLWVRDARTLQWEYLSSAFEAIYGLRVAEALAGDTMQNWLDLIVPEDRATARASIERVRAGEHRTFEVRIRRRDGAIRWLRETDFPMVDQAGSVQRIGGVGQDVTDLKAFEQALRDSEERLRTLLEGIPQLVWRSADNGLWTWSSPQWQAFTGQSLKASLGLGWLDAVHPEDREQARKAWETAPSQGLLDVEYRVRRDGDGAWLWHHTRSLPVRDESGHTREWLGTTTDVQEMKRLHDLQVVLVGELQHRTRNLLGVVRAMMEKNRPGEHRSARFQGPLRRQARCAGASPGAAVAPVRPRPHRFRRPARVRAGLARCRCRKGHAGRTPRGSPALLDRADAGDGTSRARDQCPEVRRTEPGRRAARHCLVGRTVRPRRQALAPYRLAGERRCHATAGRPRSRVRPRARSYRTRVAAPAERAYEL